VNVSTGTSVPNTRLRLKWPELADTILVTALAFPWVW
jgi:hypothetical protein